MRIQKLIVSGAAALAIGGPTMGAAHAATIVYDPANFAQAVQQLAQMTQQLAIMRQQYQQLLQTYQAISHLPQNVLNTLGQQLNVDQFRNTLPAQSNVLGALMDGTNLGTGSLAAAAQGYLTQNSVYVPTAPDFEAKEMQRNANSVAGAQAMASALYQSAANRVTALQGLETLLASAPDMKAVADIQVRISAEQAYIQAQQVQAQSLAMWQASQERNQEQRILEDRRRQMDTLIQSAKANGG